MTFAYNYNHRWRKFAKENFANLVKSRTLNLAKFSRGTIYIRYVVLFLFHLLTFSCNQILNFATAHLCTLGAVSTWLSKWLMKAHHG